MGWKLRLPTDVIDGPEFSVREPSLNDFSLGQFSFPGENHPLSDWERGWGMRWTRQNRGCECWGKPLCFCSYLFVFGLTQICSGLTPTSVLRVTPGSSQRTKCSSRDGIWVNSMQVKWFKLCTICPGQSAAFSWCFSFLRVDLLFSRSGLFCALPLMIPSPPFPEGHFNHHLSSDSLSGAYGHSYQTICLSCSYKPLSLTSCFPSPLDSLIFQFIGNLLVFSDVGVKILHLWSFVFPFLSSLPFCCCCDIWKSHTCGWELTRSSSGCRGQHFRASKDANLRLFTCPYLWVHVGYLWREKENEWNFSQPSWMESCIDFFHDIQNTL